MQTKQARQNACPEIKEEFKKEYNIQDVPCKIRKFVPSCGINRL